MEHRWIDDKRVVVWHEKDWAYEEDGIVKINESAGAGWAHPDNLKVTFLGVADSSIIDGSVITYASIDN